MTNKTKIISDIVSYAINQRKAEMAFDVKYRHFITKYVNSNNIYSYELKNLSIKLFKFFSDNKDYLFDPERNKQMRVILKLVDND